MARSRLSAGCFRIPAGLLLTDVHAGPGHPDSGAVQDAESVGFLGQRPIIGRPRSETQLVVRLNQPLPSLVLQMRWILTLRHPKGRTPSNGSHHQPGVSVGNAGLGGDERAFPGNTDNSRQAWLFRRLCTAPATTAEPISATNGRVDLSRRRGV